LGDASTVAGVVVRAAQHLEPAFLVGSVLMNDCEQTPPAAPAASTVRMLDEREIRELVGPAEALAAVREAFVRLAAGEATLPPILDFEFPEHDGDAHIKGAHLHGDPRFSVKVATGFYRNPERGLSVTSGLSVVFSAETGKLDTLLFDNGYLTELRTGAAGALGADLLARRELEEVLIVGAGGQARFQLEALLGVRRPARVSVFARSAERAAALVAEIEQQHGLPAEVADELEDAVRRADLIVTTTPARAPLIRAEWLRPGVHVTAMGSDLPEKQELDVEVLRRADVVAVDHLPSASRHGELHHALEAGAIALADVIALGDLAAGTVAGRTSEDQITVVDLVGVGVQDAAVASAAVTAAARRGVGRVLEL
jgi:ornithine cyclodeaminase/alanine dehydrogenase-like protein (mu-crystallin family)